METIYTEHLVTYGFAVLGFALLVSCSIASYKLLGEFRCSGVYALCASSLLMSFGFAFDTVSWALLTKGWGGLSMSEQPQWDIQQTIGAIPYVIILSGLIILPFSLILLVRNLRVLKHVRITRSDEQGGDGDAEEAV